MLLFNLNLHTISKHRSRTDQQWNNSIMLTEINPQEGKAKIDRIKNYWKHTNRNHKPHIDHNKKLEIDLRLQRIDNKIEKQRKKFQRVSLAQLSSRGIHDFPIV